MEVFKYKYTNMDVTGKGCSGPRKLYLITFLQQSLTGKITVPTQYLPR